MEIKIKTMKRCELLELSGHIDSSTAPELDRQLLDLIEAGRKNLVLSCRDVTFITSAGLKALLAAQIKTRRKVPQGEVVLSQLSPTMKEVLELVGLNHLFTIYETDTEAVGSF
jgi:anti-sigma B factor antagonist